MPPKARISRELIFQAAFNVARSEGLTAITARRVAKELNCSTQPVYSAYRSMEELKKEVIEKSKKLAVSYLMREPPIEDLPYLQFGLGSLRFAWEEPELYKIVSLSGRVLKEVQQGKTAPDFVLQKMKTDKNFAGLTDDQLTRIHTMLWFFSQGLTVLFATEQDSDPIETAVHYLRMAGRAFIEFEHNKRKP